MSVMKQIYANNFTTLALGRQGENLVRKVAFDLSDWVSEYGAGTAELIYQRPDDSAPYPVAAVRDGDTLVWTLTATDTDCQTNYGRCELRYYVGDMLAKSKIWRTWVEPALPTPSETAPPDPQQGWVDQIIAVGAAAKASADAAKADADRAAALAAQAAEKAAQTAQNASDAAKAMEAAQTAQRLAEEAQGAAETARTAAETAQAAAEQSATDAEGAKQDAETALKSAQDAAAAAANTLESIQTLYQEMQTWAQGVIQDVNDAGSVAVQSVQTAGDAQVQRVTNEGATQTANAKAQADAAAQSASGAAQSAQEAAESAAVYDDVVADVNQLKQDLSDNAKSDAVTKQSLDALWKLNQGISYQFETDDAEAYSKTVPSGAKLASVETVGGKTLVWNQWVPPISSENVFVDLNSKLSVSDGIITMYPSGDGDYSSFLCLSNFKRMANTKYYLRYTAKSSAWSQNAAYAGLPIVQGLWVASAAVDKSVTDWQTKRAIFDGISDGSGGAVFSFRKYAESSNAIVYVKDIVVINLTMLYGYGNEPSSLDDPRIAWIEQYADANPEYNAGELVSADVESVVERGQNLLDVSKAIIQGNKPYNISVTRNGDSFRLNGVPNVSAANRYSFSIMYIGQPELRGKGLRITCFGSDKIAGIYGLRTPSESAIAVIAYLDPSTEFNAEFKVMVSADTPTAYSHYHLNTYHIPDAVRSLPGYGWSVGDAHNAIQRTDNGWQYVQRVGSRDYLDGDTVTDGVATYYVLDTPSITDITELMADFPDNFEVEAGGTLTFENAAKLHVPNTEEYLISLAEVNQ